MVSRYSLNYMETYRRGVVANLLVTKLKPLNTTNLEIERVLSNKEMHDIVSSIGVGVNDYHDMSEIRYGKVIIVADRLMFA